MLTHGVIKALRLGFNVILVNPKGTTNSEEHEKVMRGKGFDRHTASAYLIALKGLKMIKNNEQLRKNVTDKRDRRVVMKGMSVDNNFVHLKYG